MDRFDGATRGAETRRRRGGRIAQWTVALCSQRLLSLGGSHVQGGPDTPIDFVLGNPGSGSDVGCLPSLRLSCSLVHKSETSETRFKALQAVHLA